MRSTSVQPRRGLIGAGATTLALVAVLCVGSVAQAGAAVYSHGSGKVKPTWGVDFDSAVFNTVDSAKEDLKWDIVSNTERYIETYSGASIKQLNTTRPGYLKCSGLTLDGPAKINIKNVPEGTWFCFKTRQHRLTRFRVDHVGPYPAKLPLTFTTWV